MTENATSYKNWRVERDNDDILWLLLDRHGEKVNSLSTEVLSELENIISDAETRTPRGLVLMSAKSTGFIFGADIREFGHYTDAEEVTTSIERVHGMFNRLEQLRCTTVSAIEGYCLGGGLELSLACDYRIAKDVSSTKIGFPEVQLGIFPGFGGSARSVHQIGGMKAMELMLTARQLSARKARAAGLVDEVVSRHESLYWAARRAVLSRKKSRGPSLLGKLSNLGPARSLLAGQMRKKTASKAKKEHYPALYSLIDTWQNYGGSRDAMMREEAKAVGKLMVSSQAEGLRRVFSLMERLKSEGKQSDFRARNVHVVGAGVMGGDIAAWCVVRGLNVSLQDREMKYIEPALKRAEKLFKKKLRDPAKVKAAIARLQPDVDGERVGRADVVIEAIFENLEAKQKLFKDIEPQLKPDAVMATNTSAIPLEDIASVLKKPSRLIGLHFFNPVPKMPLVEVVASKNSDSDALKRGAAFCGQISRFPLPVKSSPGFLVNRVLAPYMLEALSIHLEGTPVEAIDAAAEAFGMPMGPVELADTVGLDVGLSVTSMLGGESTKKEQAHIRKFVDAGKLGKKSGEGIYRWVDDKPQKNREAARGHDLAAIAERLIRAYTDECKAALKEKIVADEDLLDAGMVFGTGFAPFRGGPLNYLKHGDKQPKVESPRSSGADQAKSSASNTAVDPDPSAGKKSSASTATEKDASKPADSPKTSDDGSKAPAAEKKPATRRTTRAKTSTAKASTGKSTAKTTASKTTGKSASSKTTSAGSKKTTSTRKPAASKSAASKATTASKAKASNAAAKKPATRKPAATGSKSGGKTASGTSSAKASTAKPSAGGSSSETTDASANKPSGNNDTKGE